MNIFTWIIFLSASLLVPAISVSYVFLRLASRQDQLKKLFSHPGILVPYLDTKGQDVTINKGESPKQHIDRLKANFEKLFTTELSREYGHVRFICAICFGSLFSAVVMYVVVISTAGQPVLKNGGMLPPPVLFGLLGAYAWSLWLLLSGYEALDLTPSSFYWIPFRYVVAIVSGLLATEIFKEEGIQVAFAFVITSIPYPELIRYLQASVPKLEGALAGQPPLSKLQGMQQATISRLQALGIQTTQELAYADPLMLLFRTSFSPKVVIDWIDQALLYNYVLDISEKLRVRGIRGAIELSNIQEDDLVLDDLRQVLGITNREIIHLRRMLWWDHQVGLINKIWEVFRLSE